MELKDIRAFFDANKEKDDVKAYLSELGKPSKEALIEFAKKQDNLEGLVPELDRRVSKAVEEFKTKGMQKEIEKAVEKAKQETERELKAKHKIIDDPALLEVEKLRKELESERSEKQKEKLRAKIREKLPEELRDFSDHFIGQDEERTEMVLSNFAKQLDAYGNKLVDAKIKGGKYTPGGNNNSDKTPPSGKVWTREEISRMTPEEYKTHSKEIMDSMSKGGIK